MITVSPPDEPLPDERESRAAQIYARFKKFHADNPQVWVLFEKFALHLIDTGRSHYAISCITERVRWHLNVETVGDEVKINNDYRAYYARMFIAKYPQHEDFFAIRKRTSANRDAYDTDMPVFRTGPAGDESRLMDDLRKL